MSVKITTSTHGFVVGEKTVVPQTFILRLERFKNIFKDESLFVISDVTSDSFSLNYHSSTKWYRKLFRKILG